MARKVYVEVVATFTPEGKILPMSICWESGTVYQVDRILDVRPAASLKVGGSGMRYTVRIWNKETYMYLDETRWYVEGRN